MEPRDASRPHEQRASGVAPARLAGGGVGLNEWAGRLLGFAVVVVEASPTRVVAQDPDGGAAFTVIDDTVVGASCMCGSFGQLGGCWHVRRLRKLRKALAAQAERSTLAEIRRIAAERTGSRPGRGSLHPPPAAPARLLLEAQRG